MKKISLFCFLLAFIVMKSLNAQTDDPYERMRKLARSAQTAFNSNAGDKVISTSDPLYAINAKAPIQFVPFELKDKLGNPISPDLLIALPNGRKITMQEYLVKINDFERELNKAGYSLRKDSLIHISKLVTDDRYKQQKVLTMPTPLKPRITGGDLESYGRITNTSGYSFVPYVLPPEEKNSRPADMVYKGKVLTKAQIKNKSIKAEPSYNALNSSKLLHERKDENPFNYELGNPSIISAAISFNFIRSLKVYSTNLNDVTKNKSQFRLDGLSEVNGSVFGYSFNIAKASAFLDAPADLSKTKTLNASVSALGKTYINYNESYTASSGPIVYEDRYAKGIEVSAGVTIPIFGPLTFVGKIGVRGDIGLEYALKATGVPDVSISVKPIVDVKVYAEIGIGVGDMAVIGIGGNLTLIKADVDLVGTIAVGNLYAVNAVSYPLSYKYNVGLNLTLLSGNMYVFGKLCTPSLWGMLPQACYTYTHEIYSWEGYKINTTLAQDQILMNLPLK